MLATAETFGDVSWDEESRSILCGDNSPSHLTIQQATVFLALLHGQGRTVTRNHILDQMWGDRDDGPEERIVDVIVCRLRRRLHNIGSETRIAVERSIGFRLEFVGREQFVTCRLTEPEFRAIAPALDDFRKNAMADAES